MITEVHDWRRGEGTIKCAKADRSSAIQEDEPIDEFLGKYHVWLMRPNRPRKGAA